MPLFPSASLVYHPPPIPPAGGLCRIAALRAVKLATWLWRKAQEALATTEPLAPAPEPFPHAPSLLPLPEAPASVNVEVQIGGRLVRLPLRDSDETRLLARLDALPRLGTPRAALGYSRPGRLLAACDAPEAWHGVASSHPLRGSAVRGLRCVKHDHPQSPYVFVSEREAPMTDSNFRKMLARAGHAAGFDFLVHPHMLRHATGYKLANDGQDTRAIQHSLGHKNMQHTVRYTELNSTRFNKFWND